jgi:hypothetical protein
MWMVNNEWGKEFYGKKGFRVKILREKKVGGGEWDDEW